MKPWNVRFFCVNNDLLREDNHITRNLHLKYRIMQTLSSFFIVVIHSPTKCMVSRGNLTTEYVACDKIQEIGCNNTSISFIVLLVKYFITHLHFDARFNFLSLFYRQHLRSEDHIKLRSKRFGYATQTMKILKSCPFLGQRKKYSLF